MTTSPDPKNTGEESGSKQPINPQKQPPAQTTQEETPMVSKLDTASAFFPKMSGVGLGSFASLRPAATHFNQAGTTENLYLSVEVGEQCQLRCQHCIYKRGVEAPPHKNMQAAIESLLARNPLWVSFSGKEPTLFPKHLSKWSAMAKDSMPGAQVIVMTNGLLLPRVGADIAENIDTFDISLDGDAAAHAWMRGHDNLFDKTLTGIDWVVKNTDKRVGIIATAVHAILPDGRRQIESLAPLAKLLENRYGADGQVSLSASLYYGAPTDPLRLTRQDLDALVQSFEGTSFPVRILWTVSYAHLFPLISKRFGWNVDDLQWDANTNLPILQIGNLADIVPFHLSDTEQLVLRLGNRGHIHLGCDHLDLGEQARKYAVGTLDDPISALANAKAQSRGMLPEECLRCEHFAFCRGGDPHSGKFYGTQGKDPYCPLLIN